MTATWPTDGRLDGPVHEWFGLSYSNYAVLHRTLMQSMPLDWQDRIVACLEELDDAYHHIDHPRCYQVTAATEVEYGDLTDAQMRQIGAATCTEEDHEPGTAEAEHCPHYYDADSNEHDRWHRALVPTSDPIPDYNRGRTYIPPAPSTQEPPMPAAEHTPTVAVDFDGVVHAYSRGWADGTIYDPPVDGAFDAIRQLQATYAVFIHTARDPFQVAVWLRGLGLAAIADSDGGRPQFWNNRATLLVTSRKLPAVAYVDDRAVRFVDWPSTLAALSGDPS